MTRLHSTSGKIHITDEGRILVCGATTEPCKYLKKETPESPRHFAVEDRAAAERQAAVIAQQNNPTVATTRKGLKKRVKRNVTFESSKRTQSNVITLNSDVFAKTPNPVKLVSAPAFDAFHTALAA